MSSKEADIETDISPAIDQGESVTIMEPLLIGETSVHRGELTELAVDLAARSAGFRRSLTEGVVKALTQFGVGADRLNGGAGARNCPEVDR